MRIHSTGFPKNSASCDSRISSGVRLPPSHGDHCWGETPNSSAHCLQPPRPGYFACRHCLMLCAIVFRRASVIFPTFSLSRQGVIGTAFILGTRASINRTRMFSTQFHGNILKIMKMRSFTEIFPRSACAPGGRFGLFENYRPVEIIRSVAHFFLAKERFFVKY